MDEDLEPTGDGISGDTPRSPDRAAAARAAAQRMRKRTARPRQVAKGFVSALRETASDMLREARRAAAEAHDEMWSRYEAKTKHRRRNDDD
jgi:hypothetical protein